MHKVIFHNFNSFSILFSCCFLQSTVKNDWVSRLSRCWEFSVGVYLVGLVATKARFPYITSEPIIYLTHKPKN